MSDESYELWKKLSPCEQRHAFEYIDGWLENCGHFKERTFLCIISNEPMRQYIVSWLREVESVIKEHEKKAG